MERDLEYISLFEIYKGLLTEKQREIFTSHYLFDLSLSEIAETEGGSRQSVYDAVKKVKIKLSEYENLLHVREKNLKIQNLMESDIPKDLKEKLTEIINV